MPGADLDVVRDIPGYKLILKAVLKSQIQQLVGILGYRISSVIRQSFFPSKTITKI